MLFKFILVVQTIVAAGLVTVILMQRSEGGGLGVGGSSSGLMTARGAADFLTRATAILAALFVILSIVLAGLATVERSPAEIDASLAKQAPAAPLSTPAAPIVDPLAGTAAAGGAPAADGDAANTAVPLAQ